MDFFTDYSWLFGILGGGIVIIILFVLALIVVGIVASWKLYKKAGRKGWEALIPIYGSWVLVEIAGLNWWWFLLLCVDIAFRITNNDLTLAINICGFLASFNCYYNIARKFGKDKTTSIFAGIFPFIFLLIFAFSKNNVYDINIPVNANGIFGNEENNYGNNSNYHDDMNRYDSVNQQLNNEGIEQSTISVDSDNSEYSYCGNCGLKLDKDIKFCPKCGREKK